MTLKPQKGQMKCFHCRRAFSMKDGNWLNWNNMQVFLCKVCEAETVNRPERRSS